MYSDSYIESLQEEIDDVNKAIRTIEKQASKAIAKAIRKNETASLDAIQEERYNKLKPHQAELNRLEDALRKANGQRSY